MTRVATNALALAGLTFLTALCGTDRLTAAGKGRGNSSCTDKNGTSLGCLGQIAFIDFDILDQLEPMIPAIEAAKDQLWPSKGQLRFEVVAWGAGDINALCNQVEALVNDMVSHGYTRIGLPARSTFLAPFIQGSCGSLSATLDTRHPGIVFAVTNPGTPVANGVPNLFRFVDVNTTNFATDPGVGPLVGENGEILILYQQSDSVSEGVRDDFLALASDLAIPATAVAIPFNGVTFNMSGVGAAIAAVPSGSLVVHVANGGLLEEYTQAALTAGNVFVSSSGAGPIRHYGGNYFPVSNTIPVDLELGFTTLDGPSLEMEQLGFPIDAAGWAAEPKHTLYIEAYGWLATRGRFVGVLDHHLQFDELGTRIAYKIGDLYLPANTLFALTRNDRENPRWPADRHPWDWTTIFGNN